jgi:hypothetical protein
MANHEVKILGARPMMTLMLLLAFGPWKLKDDLGRGDSVFLLREEHGPTCLKTTRIEDSAPDGKSIPPPTQTCSQMDYLRKDITPFIDFCSRSVGFLVTAAVQIRHIIQTQVTLLKTA